MTCAECDENTDAAVMAAVVLAGPMVHTAHLQTQPCGQGLIIPFKHGNYWSALSVLNRHLWLDGFTEGQAHAFQAWQSEVQYTIGQAERMTKALLPFYDGATLEPVMTWCQGPVQRVHHADRDALHRQSPVEWRGHRSDAEVFTAA